MARNLILWHTTVRSLKTFLSRVLGLLYTKNNINDEVLSLRISRRLIIEAACFLVFFLLFLVRTLFKDGFAYNPSTGDIFIEPQKYLNNLIDMWYVALTLVVGVVLVLYGIVRTIYNKVYIFGIWFAGIGCLFGIVIGLISKAGSSFFGNLGLFSFSFCEPTQLMSESWIYGTLVSFIAGLFLFAVLPMTLKKRG